MMNSNPDYNQLVIQAQLGDRESVDTLAKLVRGRLCAYVYRIILEKDLTEDVVQDTLIEMALFRPFFNQICKKTRKP